MLNWYSFAYPYPPYHTPCIHCIAYPFKNISYQSAEDLATGSNPHQFQQTIIFSMLRRSPRTMETRSISINFNFEILKKVAKSIKINCIELFENLKNFIKTWNNFFVGDGENLLFHIFDLTYTCVENYVTGKKLKPRPKF